MIEGVVGQAMALVGTMIMSIGLLGMALIVRSVRDVSRQQQRRLGSETDGGVTYIVGGIRQAERAEGVQRVRSVPNESKLAPHTDTYISPERYVLGGFEYTIRSQRRASRRRVADMGGYVDVALQLYDSTGATVLQQRRVCLN